MQKLIFFSAIWLFISAPLYAQDTLPRFASPLDIPLYLSGNFAEMRRNHFHTGIDIKTQGVEGQTVRAVEDGVVSRINISPWGYGHAVYIDHPNGYTTVYGHLSALAPKLKNAAREKQYADKSFSVDFTPDPPIEVKRGEKIALSGNTGGSGGPHLHFEIRRTTTEHPLNPLLFNFDIKDNISPTIRGVRFHPLSDTSLVNGAGEAKSFVVLGSAGSYHLKAGQTITVYGAFGISLHALDFLNGYPNKCGIYRLELEVDGKNICTQEFDSLDFATVRNINAYKDYEVFKNNNWHYHKSYVEPGNHLDIYHPFPAGRGILNFPTDGLHHAVYKATDAYGNVSTLAFDFRSAANPDATIPEVKPYDAWFAWNQPNHFEYGDELEITIPEGALYEDLRFEFGREMPDARSLSPVYLVHNDNVPLQEAITLKFAWKKIPKKLRPQVVVRYSDLRGRTRYLTGTSDASGLEVKSKDFGKFSLVPDTVAPVIYAYKRSAGGQVYSQTELDFKMTDSETGIAKYNGYLNGEWVLMAYEPKEAKLWLNVGESNFKKGENTLRIEIEDGVGNRAETVHTYTY